MQVYKNKTSFLKTENLVFILLIILTFGMILFYNLLTPYFSDDIFSRTEVRDFNSLWDFIVLQYDMYLTYNPRVVGQFFKSLFSAFDKTVFNIFNSVVFIALVYMIYVNISFPLKGLSRRIHRNPVLYLFSFIFLWLYAVDFGETILWLSGAANYLWTSAVILGCITFYRYQLASEKQDKKYLAAVFCFILGLIGGWCNENTSGGMFVVIFMLTLIKLVNDKAFKLKAYMVTAHLGTMAGFAGILLSPGAYKRLDAFEESHSGLSGYFSRIYHCLVSINELFFELICLFIIVTVLALVIKKQKISVLTQVMPFFIAGIATCFALVLIPPPTIRAYFGAGVFLIIAFLRSFVLFFYDHGDDADEKIPEGKLLSSQKGIFAGRCIILSILCLWLFFDYSTNLVNLARIKREDNERIELILEAKKNGNDMVIVPQYRPEFANRYSSAHRHDMNEDERNWINVFYRGYYGIKVRAIPREEWD